MGDRTGIEWTDATWNPIRGCSRVSPGCVNCYAEKVAARFGGPGMTYEGLVHSTGAWNGKTQFVEHLLTQPLRWTRGRRIFVNSMSDLFHESVPFEVIDKIFSVMACTTRHTYQILTKRPERMLEYFDRLTWRCGDGPEDVIRWDEELRTMGGPHQIVELPEEIDPLKVWPQWTPARNGRGGYDNCGPVFPLENVWLGVSVENQQTANERIPLLLQVPAKKRFISAEPLLESLDLGPFLWGPESPCEKCPLDADCECGWKTKFDLGLKALDWVIVGGESGRGARPFNLEWADDLVSQCRRAKTAVFVKQLGAMAYRRREDGALDLVMDLQDTKGGDWSEWPQHLRVREFPA